MLAAGLRSQICGALRSSSFLKGGIRFVPKRGGVPSRMPLFGEVRKGTVSWALTVSKEVPHRIVGWWFTGVAGMTFGAITIGALTRLTESGLSMVDWKLFGRPPPRSDEEWVVEFEKYKATPEYQYKHTDITLGEFKFIWHMEYGHRMWGRLIGLAFYLPAGIMWAKGMFSPAVKRSVLGCSVILACQGLLGWYMVKSGLDPKNFEGPSDVPRVSQYRLAAHLSTAMVLYSLLLWNGLSVLLPAKSPATILPAMLKLRKLAMGNKTLAFLTSVSGAFVAGLDAGLIYNSFPLMADKVIPDDLFAFAPWLSNFTENPTTVQFNHRILGITTVTFITFFALMSRGVPLHPRAKKAVAALAFTAWMQVALGITTLLQYVPTSLAAMHQAGAIFTLSTALWVSHELKLAKLVKHIPK